uniref:NADH dehydrogenase subunit 2 n=1 Tax=Xylophaga dorsalis TaxID=1526741 RepID=UPI00202984C9|nr:NADH dehydrogenase subunit 2 [Xylophaga dorsalis]UPX88888.1 NADH dehydrogenase subunit 2 [Xylophaga dorsalis]
MLSFYRFNPSSIFFFFFMLLGLILVIMSGGLLGVWVGLECGFLGVVSLLAGDSSYENEGCMKYFVFQSVGSGVLFIGFIIMEGGTGYSIYWILLGLILKLGLFPFHFWVPAVLSLSSWFGCYVISLWQKLSPLWFLSGCGLGSVFILFVEVVVCITGLIGALGGLGVLHFRVLLAYSSLIHTSWVVLLSMVSLSGVAVYFMVYSVVLGLLILKLFNLNIYSYLDISKKIKSKTLFPVFLDFISLAGVPPFLGSIPKILVILLCFKSFPIGVFFLIFSSMISLYYYLSVVISLGVGLGSSFFLMQSPKFFITHSTWLGVFLSVFFLVSLGFGGY